MGDALPCSLEGVKGKWVPSFDHEWEKIYREDYDSVDFPVSVVLEGDEKSWTAEVYRKDSGGWERSSRREFSGSDAYRQAYDFFSEFSDSLAEMKALRDSVSRVD